MGSWLDRLRNAFRGQPQESVRAEFRCAACDEVAATVHAVPRGRTHPLADHLSAKTDRIVVAGFLGELAEVVQRQPKRLWSAVETADPRSLWSLDPLWAAFYCPDCDRSYCQKHWQTEVAYADDYPGWYEHTSGRCPEGHERVLDD